MTSRELRTICLSSGASLLSQFRVAFSSLAGILQIIDLNDQFNFHLGIFK